jgi:hypothetical protein
MTEPVAPAVAVDPDAEISAARAALDAADASPFTPAAKRAEAERRFEVAYQARYGTASPVPGVRVTPESRPAPSLTPAAATAKIAEIRTELASLRDDTPRARELTAQMEAEYTGCCIPSASVRRPRLGRRPQRRSIRRRCR